jgi:hypothetical protein
LSPAVPDHRDYQYDITFRKAVNSGASLAAVTAALPKLTVRVRDGDIRLMLVDGGQQVIGVADGGDDLVAAVDQDLGQARRASTRTRGTASTVSWLACGAASSSHREDSRAMSTERSAPSL